MPLQCASSLLMVRPHFFRANDETASTNTFQNASLPEALEAEAKALAEFEHVVNRLRLQGIHIVEADNTQPDAPDAVFPNNWISFHHDGSAVLYPMMHHSRRKERNSVVLDQIRKEYLVEKIHDLTHFESEGKFLEGTGSVVFDHRSKIAYAALSPRTHPEVFFKLCNIISYKPFTFEAFVDGKPVYHTNVVLNIGDKYAVCAFETIRDVKQRNDLRRLLAFTGHELIPVTVPQVKSFAGNMLEVCNAAGKHFTLLSNQAIRSLHLKQINTIGDASELLAFDVATIEHFGGGSIRCMVAEIFCPEKTVKA
jgi:hypothetical protein